MCSSDFNTKMQELEVLKKELKAKADSLKKEFAAYIKDKNIPLVTRWETFCAADDLLKNHDSYIVTARSPGLKYVMDNYFDAPEIYGRGKQIHFNELLEEWCFDGELHPDCFSYKMKNENENIALMTSAMEEILSLNLGSFCYDW